MNTTDITINAGALPIDTSTESTTQTSVTDLSGREFQRVLYICGYTYSDFARYIERSDTFVNRTLRNSLSLPSRYIQKLEEMVTPENLREALHRIRTGTMNKYLSGYEMRKLLIKQGYTFKEFADFIQRTGPFVSDILGRKPYSIPLRYIDTLRTFITISYYDADLKKLRQKE
ncbi:MAG TPA: hypothetical protein VEC36_03355 [Patescibacteria group bacterium]|nr:hypothetical protein [Patescibacteria group bacterium]